MSGEGRMLGCEAGDPHKNTAKSKRVNDRERRRRKRIERRALKSSLKGEARCA